jgi:hypothetical protein
LGPTPYLSFNDSPFKAIPGVQLETFEDHLLNIPGVSADAGGVASVVFGSSIHDSVDGDDGVIDGSGLNGDSFFSSNGAGGINFSFDRNVIGSFPTSAGLVWTDGAGEVTFQAFGPTGNLLGTIGPVSNPGVFPDDRIDGTTAEDRFFGVTDPGGISKIFISNSSGGIEVDHVQYAAAGTVTAVPLPAAVGPAAGLLAALGAGLGLRRRQA